MRTRGGVLVPLLVVALAWVGPAAHADDDQLVVSGNGRTWGPNLARPLFDPGVRWVPGDERTATFFVGNRAAQSGELSLKAAADDAGGLLARADLDLAVRRGSGVWTTWTADARLHPLPGPALAAGADDRISVRARFHPSSPNASQVRSLPLEVEVVLSQVGAVVSDPGANGDGALPDTGGVDWRFLGLGVLLIALGTAITAITVRRKDTYERP